jgi:accessory gene regulator B
MSYLSFSKRWAGFLAAKTNISPEQEIVLTYIIEVLVLNLGNLILTLLLALLLGVFPGTLACLITVALFRHTAGGAHSNSPWRCAVVTIAVFPLMALLAAHLSPLKQLYVDILIALSTITGFITISLLAPVDSPSAPIISPARRKKLKILSLLVMMLVTITLIILRQSTWVYAKEITLCLTFSVLWVSFILSKPGHRVMALIDIISYKRKEV